MRNIVIALIQTKDPKNVIEGVHILKNMVGQNETERILKIIFEEKIEHPKKSDKLFTIGDVISVEIPLNIYQFMPFATEGHISKYDLSTCSRNDYSVKGIVVLNKGVLCLNTIFMYLNSTNPYNERSIKIIEENIFRSFYNIPMNILLSYQKYTQAIRIFKYENEKEYNLNYFYEKIYFYSYNAYGNGQYFKDFLNKDISNFYAGL